MKTLVTGGAGFIGSHVAEQLLRAGHEVAIVDDLSTGHERNLPAGAVFHRLDIRTEEFSRLIERLKPEAIFHLAAQMDVRRSVADPLHDAGINVLGTLRLLDAAGRAGCAAVVFSSTGGAIYGEQDLFPAPEAHPCRPVSPYGVSKLCAESYLAYFERSGGPRFTALRYSNVYGPRQDPHGEAGVVAIFSRHLLSGKTAIIYGDGRQTRDFVFVEDVARANLLALEKSARGVFNIGTGVETDVNTLFSILARHAGFKGEPRHAPERPGEQRRSVVDPGLAAQTLGWRPAVALEKGLSDTLNYFREHPEL